MYVGAVHLGDALRVCAGWAHLAVVKAPMNFNIQGMLHRAGPCAELVGQPSHLRKMQIMIVRLTPFSLVVPSSKDSAAQRAAKKPRTV
jgi:hypothetical protein